MALNTEEALMMIHNLIETTCQESDDPVSESLWMIATITCAYVHTMSKPDKRDFVFGHYVDMLNTLWGLESPSDPPH